MRYVINYEIFQPNKVGGEVTDLGGEVTNLGCLEGVMVVTSVNLLGGNWDWHILLGNWLGNC